MKYLDFLYSERFAIACGVIVLTLAATFAYLGLGWFGIFLLGLVGMVATTRLDLHDGNAVADFDHGSTSVGMIARQIKQREDDGRDDLGARMRQEERRKRRHLLIYHLNTVWLTMIGLGFAMFTTHQI